VNPVLAVVPEVGVFAFRREEVDVLGRFADGDDGDGVQRERQAFPDGLLPEIEDENPAEAHLHGLQEDGLPGETQVDVRHLVLRDTAADDEEGAGLVTRLGKVLLRQGGPQGDVGEDLAGLGLGDKPVAERLAVHARGGERRRGDEFAEFLFRDFPGRVVAAVTAVAVQERVQGGVGPVDYFAGAAFGDFRLSFFEIIVGHVGMDFMRRYGFSGPGKKIYAKKSKYRLRYKNKSLPLCRKRYKY